MRQTVKSLLRSKNLTRINIDIKMDTRVEELKTNFDVVRKNIDSLTEKPNQTRLVAVSKYKPVEDLKIAYDLRQRVFGESYVQELVDKSGKLPKDVLWHFIGSLQTNKCKTLAAIPNLSTVETLESMKKAEILNRIRVEKELPKLNVFLQVNTNKSGIPVDKEGCSPQLKEVAQYIQESCPKLNLLGLMTIGSFEHSSNEGENLDFELLLKTRGWLQSELNLEILELSMGMSMDYELAIKKGSTNVRVGSNLFGSRN